MGHHNLRTNIRIILCKVVGFKGSAILLYAYEYRRFFRVYGKMTKDFSSKIGKVVETAGTTQEHPNTRYVFKFSPDTIVRTHNSRKEVAL